MVDPLFFVGVLSGFNSCTKDEIDPKKLLLITGLYDTFERCGRHLICDILDLHWRIDIMEEIEDWVQTILDCTILHGAGLKYKNKGLLLLGASMAGKTTLTYSLCCSKSAKYLDDDSIYYFNNMFYGLNLPMALRDMPQNKNCETIGYVFDYVDHKRYLVQNNQLINKLNKIDIILFPRYETNGGNACKELTKSELFIGLIQNIRHKRNITDLRRDITNLSLNAHGYSISYNSSANAEKLINSLI